MATEEASHSFNMFFLTTLRHQDRVWQYSEAQWERQRPSALVKVYSSVIWRMNTRGRGRSSGSAVVWEEAWLPDQALQVQIFLSNGLNRV